MSPDESQDPNFFSESDSSTEDTEIALEGTSVTFGDAWDDPVETRNGVPESPDDTAEEATIPLGNRQTAQAPGGSTGIPLNLSLGNSPTPAAGAVDPLQSELDSLRQQKQRLQTEIAELQATYDRMVRDQATELQNALGRLVQEGLNEMEQRKQTLQLSIEQLERRQERIKAEMRSTFAGSSQELAVRVQGFKDYLVGSLQDLVTTVEDIKLELPAPPPPERRYREAPPRDPREMRDARDPREMRDREPRDPREPRESYTRDEEGPIRPRFTEDAFENQNRMIRRMLDQYRTQPDYYGPVWQLRRTFEPVHAERVANWFFTQGGRGALRSMGSRLQNILVASAIISILRKLNGDRVRTLILADSPERLGEWRRGLQDCLGISRTDFGSDQGVVLFDAPEPLAQRAERLVKQKQLPLIVIDDSEEVVSLALLQFPLLLAFAPDPSNPPLY